LNKRIPGVLIGLLCAGLIAACGGGGNDGSSDAAETTEAADALTKAELIAQGDEICADGDKEAEALADEFAEDNEIDTENPTQEQAEEAVAEAFVPSLRRQAEELSALGAPAGDEEEVEAIVSALEAATDELEDNPGALFEAESNPLEEPSKLAADYGFENCGS